MRRLEEWWLAPRRIDALCWARILVASVLLVAYALRIPFAGDLFGPAGIGGADLYARVPDLPRFHPGIAPALDLLRHVRSESIVLILYGALLASLAALALGFWTRVAGVLACALHVLFWVRNPLAYTGWAGFATGPLLYLALAPVGRRLSLDAWLRRRRGEPPLPAVAPGWPLRLLQVHVCAMYAVAGWSRLDKPDWLAGDLVEIALTSALTSRVALDWSAFAPALAALTWTSLVLEGLAPILLWVPRMRRIWAGALVALHAGLALLLHMEVWAWSGVMIAGLLAFLLPDDAAPETPKG
jgi:HTTM domain